MTADHFVDLWRFTLSCCNCWHCASLRCLFELTCVKFWAVAVQVCRHWGEEVEACLYRQLDLSVPWSLKIATCLIICSLCGWWSGVSSLTTTCRTLHSARMFFTQAVQHILSSCHIVSLSCR